MCSVLCRRDLCLNYILRTDVTGLSMMPVVVLLLTIMLFRYLVLVGIIEIDVYLAAE